MKFLLLTALVWCICATAFSSPYLVVSDVDYYTWVVMTFFYSSLDLHKLNCSYPLPADIFKSCASLEILRRPRYVHRGSRRSICKGAQFASRNSIPVLISSRRSLSKTESRSVNPLNLSSIKLSSSNAVNAVSQTVKMALCEDGLVKCEVFIKQIIYFK